MSEQAPQLDPAIEVAAEALMERFVVELGEREETLAMVAAYDMQIAQMQAMGAPWSMIQAMHEAMFDAFARARGWEVIKDG